MKYGSGVILRSTALGPSYGHSGFFPGYLAEMMYFPDHKIAAAVQVTTSVGRAVGKSWTRIVIDIVRIAEEELRRLPAIGWAALIRKAHVGQTKRRPDGGRFGLYSWRRVRGSMSAAEVEKFTLGVVHWTGAGQDGPFPSGLLPLAVSSCACTPT